MKTIIIRIIAGLYILMTVSINLYSQGSANHPMNLAERDLMKQGASEAGCISGIPESFFQSGEAVRQNVNGSDLFEGSGTADDPWLIATADDLDNLRQFLGTGHQDKHFRQTTNIDLGVSPWSDEEGWIPVGNSVNSFHGHYDGNGKDVSGMVISRDTIEYQGLFGRNSGTIMNLGVVNANVTDNGSRAGILAGYNDSGVIDNCYSTGSIRSNHEAGRIGGLVGWNIGSIRNSSSEASVFTTGLNAGGITSANSGGGSLNNCFATGEVTGNDNVGGLVGRNQLGGQIVSCHATGDVKGTNITGGLIGMTSSDTSTDDCYATGKVSGSAWVGGLVGYVFETSVSNSFFSGIVEGESRVGGLVGLLSTNAAIIECYSEGQVNASGNWAGGLTGAILNNSTVSGSFSTADVYSEGYTIGGLSGSLENKSSIENSHAEGIVLGSDWTGGLVGWVDSSYVQKCFFSGNVEGESRVGGLVGAIRQGTISDSNSEGKVNSRGNLTGGLVGSVYDNSAISGSFSTADVFTEGNTAGGLTGTLQNNSSIENSHAKGNVFGSDWTGGLVGWVDDSSIQKSFYSGSLEGENRVGGLVGRISKGTISDCYSEGEVNSRGNWTGGLTGVVSGNSKISGCYSTAEVHSTGYTVGGLSGTLQTNSTIENSYSIGNVFGMNWVGGLVGWADSCNIENSYTANYMFGVQVVRFDGFINAGNDIIIVNSYFNTETTGETTSAGGEGKTNLEMTLQATFAGWDFENTWGILENETYPYLKWQIEPIAHNHPAEMYLLSLTDNPDGAGTLAREGMRPEGSLIAITAVANDGYMFVEWTDAEGNTFSTDQTYRFHMPAHDVALTANFEVTIDNRELSGPDQTRLKVYPNPAAHEIWIEFNNTVDEITHIRMVNLQGQLIKTVEVVGLGLQKIRLNSTTLSPGIYLLEIPGTNQLPVRVMVVGQ